MWWMKFIGCLVIISGGVILGKCLCQEKKDKIQSMKYMENVLYILEREVTYFRIALPEACQRVSKKVEAGHANVLGCIWQEMQKKEGKCFGDIWKEQYAAFFEHSICPPRCCQILLEVGDWGNVSDRELLISSIQRAREEMQQVRMEMEEKMGADIKTTQCLCSAGGIILALFLV